jgi:hypothetical protein
MSWPGALLAMLVPRVVGNVPFQTDSQALMKTGGCGNPLARRALRRHVAAYTFAFLPGAAIVAAS